MAGMTDAERRLRVLEARGEMMHGGNGGGPTLADHGELGAVLAAAIVSWDSIRWDPVEAKTAYTMMRTISLALDVLQGREVTETTREGVRALLAPTHGRYRIYGWQERKHPDALALFEQLQREGHL